MPDRSAHLTFDITEIPFSTRGAWMDISPVIGVHQTAPELHLVSHQTGIHPVLRLTPLVDGEPVASTIAASPSVLTWTTTAGIIEATFDRPDTLRLRGHGVGLNLADPASALTPFTGTYLYRDPMDGSAVLSSYETGRRYRVTALAGTVTVVGAEALGEHERSVTATGDAGWEIAIEEFEAARPAYAPSLEFDAVVDASAARFGAFADAIAGWRTAATPAAELAAYVVWSATVSPRGFLGRESVLMSKHWMDKVWSWDHCFNAIALAEGEPRMALDQFLAPFDHQDASGALPDSIAHSEILYNFVKPPIHGWAFQKLRTLLPEPMDAVQLAEIYAVLAKWTRFWLDSRRAPGRILPHYQHGNDSGWDNSTTFDLDRVIEAPDLAAFLIVQLDELASLADELRNGGGDGWRRDATNIFAALMDDLWTGDNFVAVGALTGRIGSTSSLLNLLPILASSRFAPEVSARLARHITTHLTAQGLATELPSSAFYEADGYWRGPIWAPSTVLIEDGLRTAGHDGLANTISERFRALCERSGFAENFDALTGDGLRDRAYTWTASAYLSLARAAVARHG
ncbi:amylo-alpha-1,6-glucosidase [Lacisediminihabitans sp.]|jgi:hypothetical protein|uniref:amylo-alpha-1,6-glucosidase n=1 Tax=Lacisediminihabitans sp. TaxID=2787631 RepID=UPI002F953857